MNIVVGARPALGPCWNGSSGMASSPSTPSLQHASWVTRGFGLCRSPQPHHRPSCAIDAVGEPPNDSLEQTFGSPSRDGRQLRVSASSVAQPTSGFQEEILGPILAPGTDPNSVREWELDFCSRPILDSRGKRLWELLVCDSKRRLQFAKFYPNNVINSVTLKGAMVSIIETLGLPKPEKIRFFRSQMQNIVSKACAELDIQPVPSRRCISLIRWLGERYESVYSQHPGFQEGAAPLLQLEETFPLELPDTLRGDQWAFVQLPLSGCNIYHGNSLMFTD